MRVFFVTNICLWCVLFAAWTGYVAVKGLGDPTGVRVGFILAVTAVLLTAQGIIRWRRRRKVRVSA